MSKHVLNQSFKSDVPPGVIPVVVRIDEEAKRFVRFLFQIIDQVFGLLRKLAVYDNNAILREKAVKDGKTKEELLKNSELPGAPQWKTEGLSRPLGAAYDEITSKQ